MFKLDPVHILDSDGFTWLIYQAAYSVIMEDKRKEAEANKAASKRK